MTSSDALAPPGPVVVPPAGPGDRIPLSPALSLLSLFDKGESDGAFGPRHLVILGWRVRGHLDLDDLRGALLDVVERHEMLRTSIERGDGEPHQLVHPPSPPELVVTRLPGDDEDPRPRDVRVDEFVNGIEASTLPVSTLPHLRVVLGRFDGTPGGTTDGVLVLVTHHVASDGWSLHVLMGDIAHHYARRRGHPVAPLPPVRQYGDHARWQLDQLAGADADRARAHWRERLGGTRITDVRADRRTPPGTTGVYAVHRFVTDRTLATRTTAFARAMRASTFMVLFSAFAALVHRSTGETDLVVPTITSGRGDPSFEQTVGPFFNLVPLRVDLTGCRTFTDLVRTVRGSCLDAYTHELPFAEISAQVPEINRTYERDDGAVHAFQVLQSPGMADAETVGDVEYAEVRRREIDCPRTSDIPNGVLWGLDVLPTGEFAGTIRFNTLQFDASTLKQMVEGFHRILANGLADPARPLTAL